YFSTRLLSHFLLHAQTGLKVAQIARLLDLSRPTASRQQKFSSKEAIQQAHHRLEGRPYGKLWPRYAGPIAQFLVTHPKATRVDTLEFIERTFHTHVSTVALSKFLKKFGLDAATRLATTTTATAETLTVPTAPSAPPPPPPRQQATAETLTVPTAPSAPPPPPRQQDTAETLAAQTAPPPPPPAPPENDVVVSPPLSPLPTIFVSPVPPPTILVPPSVPVLPQGQPVPTPAPPFSSHARPTRVPSFSCPKLCTG